MCIRNERRNSGKWFCDPTNVVRIHSILSISCCIHCTREEQIRSIYFSSARSSHWNVLILFLFFVFFFSHFHLLFIYFFHFEIQIENAQWHEGGTIIGPAFGGFAQYAAHANVMSGRGHPAFYPQPIICWGYPSPPVSPTTYFPPHIAAAPPPIRVRNSMWHTVRSLFFVALIFHCSVLRFWFHFYFFSFYSGSIRQLFLIKRTLNQNWTRNEQKILAKSSPSILLTTFNIQTKFEADNMSVDADVEQTVFLSMDSVK